MKISMKLENVTKTHYQKRFFEDVVKLYSNFTYNPFELDVLTRTDDTSVWFDPRIIADTILLELIGK